MDILKWVTNNPVMTVVLVVIIAALIVFVVTKRKGLLYKAALYAVSVAEEEWGSKTGRIKFAEVYTYLKTQFPILTMFLPEQKLTDIIENALSELKKILASKVEAEEE